MASTTTFEGWRFAHYFEFVERKGRNVTIRCTLCPGQKLLSTAVNTTSNLSKHLQRQHANTKLVAKDNRSDATVEFMPTPNKQQKLDFHQVTKAESDRLVASFIVEKMLPVNTVESPSFRNILSKIQITGDRQPWSDRKTFTRYLDQCYATMENNLKRNFETLEYVSTSADIWTSHNKSFLGMTVHWINPVSFQREKAAIACKRIKGRHTVHMTLSLVKLSRFILPLDYLSHKVTATVTDNRSNFIKAFKMYELPASDSDEGDDDEGVAFTDVGEVLSTNPEGQFSLPPHLRCASHTLNLISTNDVDKWLTSNTESKAVYRSATGKCFALWTKSSHSTVASELVEEMCKRKRIVPTSTRWNSVYDALSRITDIPLPELNSLCSSLGIKAVTEREYTFLKEYCTVMKPLTVALDILQGEDNCYYGSLLPTLKTLMSRTLALQNGLSRMTAGLPDVIVQVCPPCDLKSESHQNAICTCARQQREAARSLLLAECRAALRGAGPILRNQTSATSYSTTVEKEFFYFDEEQEDTTSFNCDTEVIEYFKSGSEMEVLNRFPQVKSIFLKLNTSPTPSSAPVERLFSLGGLVLTPKRNRLSDTTFEKLLLMRYNHRFSGEHPQ
ncbi:hypothetical protein ACEWY4_003534 [Coilia grayii]|uniref:BED-type domain-containing protein n=1 Tax=Coilia grayii TaxID=363190 RepID=A0ABD1KRH4_9TELE